jgi:LDH2 family malate/lactate/ureidoglycolate dehydrogenase
MKLCIAKAKEFGMASITVKNSNHFGIAGYYSMMALEQNMIGVCMTNSQSWIVPTFGKKPILGTNPISVAVPSLHEYPYVLDMATSAVSYGKVEIARKKNIEIPDGWAINEEGNATVNPNEIVPRKKGALLPLGGTEITSGYKGYGLAMLVEILCSALSGGAFSTEIGAPNSSEPAGVSHFFMAMKLNSFRPILDFKTQMDAMIQEIKNTPKAGNNENIYIAGEKEFELEKYNLKNGIPLIQPVYEEMIADGKRVGLTFDLKPIIN